MYMRRRSTRAKNENISSNKDIPKRPLPNLSNNKQRPRRQQLSSSNSSSSKHNLNRHNSLQPPSRLGSVLYPFQYPQLFHKKKTMPK